MIVSRSSAESIATTRNGERGESPEYLEASRGIARVERHEERPAKHDWPRFYTVTTIAPAPCYGGIRTVAICDSFSKANELLTLNGQFFYECAYGFAVIEETICNAVYGGDFRERYWYAYDTATESYVPIEEPKPFADVSGYGIG